VNSESVVGPANKQYIGIFSASPFHVVQQLGILAYGVRYIDGRETVDLLPSPQVDREQ
jgi:hypothetical protein